MGTGFYVYAVVVQGLVYQSGCVEEGIKRIFTPSQDRTFSDSPSTVLILLIRYLDTKTEPKMRFPAIFLSMLALAAASPAPAPMDSLQRRAYKSVQFGTEQQFIMQPSNSPITNLQGIQTYFQGDGNFVVSVSSPLFPPSL